MIWWGYNQVKEVDKITNVYATTDDKRVANFSEEQDMKSVMTSENHCTINERVFESENFKRTHMQ